MKICLFNVTSTMDRIGSSEVGGLEAYTFQLAEMLIQRGHQVTIYGGKPKENLSFPSCKATLKLFPFLETQSVPDLGTRFQRLIQRIHFYKNCRDSFLKESFDAIIIFKPYDLVTAWRWRSAGLKTRIIFSVHGPEFFPFDRWLTKNIDAIYAVSRSTAEKIGDRYQVSCPVIPNFINLAQFPFLDRPQAPKEKLIVATGRLIPLKGLSPLLKALSKVRAKIPDVRLMIIGDGPEKSNLMDEVRHLNLESAVEFAGVVESHKLSSIYSKAWLFIQASTGYESFSISSLEALASGLSTLVSSQVGIKDWFIGKDAIEVFQTGNEEDLVNQIQKLLSEPWEKNQSRGRNARKIVETEFSAEKVVQEIEKLCY